VPALGLPAVDQMAKHREGTEMRGDQRTPGSPRWRSSGPATALSGTFARIRIATMERTDEPSPVLLGGLGKRRWDQILGLLWLAAFLLITEAATAQESQVAPPVTSKLIDPALWRYSVIIALLITTSFLFYYLFDWWRGIDRSGANYQLFKSAIYDREFGQRRVAIDLKLQSGVYVQELFNGETKRSQDWIKSNPVPKVSEGPASQKPAFLRVKPDRQNC
jgi:hypothetical protein